MMNYTGTQFFKASTETFATALQTKAMESNVYRLNTYKIEWQKK